MFDQKGFTTDCCIGSGQLKMPPIALSEPPEEPLKDRPLPLVVAPETVEVSILWPNSLENASKPPRRIGQYLMRYLIGERNVGCTYLLKSRHDPSSPPWRTC